jgi:EmrB/QacA subfamily drug resistance transporter
MEPRTMDTPPAGAAPVRTRAILAVVGLSLMAVISAVSGLNVALPAMARETGATQSELTWIVDAYTVVFAGLLFFAGALGDRFGRRRLLAIGLFIFGSAAAAGLVVSDPTALIVVRAAMGVGAAAIMPTTLSVITTSFPEAERPRAIGVWVGIAGGGAILGLFASALLLEWFSWQSFFALNVLLSVVALLGVVAVVPDSVDAEPPALDVVGAILSLVTVAALVFGIIEGPAQGWMDPVTLGSLALGLLAGALFIWWELRQEHPLLDPRLFRLRGFSAGSLSLTIQFFAAFGFFFIVLQYLQFVTGRSALEAALAMLPLPFVLIPTARNAPRLAQRIGFRWVAPTGLLAMALGFFLLSRLDVDTPYWFFVIGVLLFGVGMGLAGTPATTALTSSLPMAKQGVASAMNDTTREVGSAFGVAILGAVLNQSYRDALAPSVQDLPRLGRLHRVAGHRAVRGEGSGPRRGGPRGIRPGGRRRRPHRLPRPGGRRRGRLRRLGPTGPPGGCHRGGRGDPGRGVARRRLDAASTRRWSVRREDLPSSGDGGPTEAPIRRHRDRPPSELEERDVGSGVTEGREDLASGCDAADRRGLLLPALGRCGEGAGGDTLPDLERRAQREVGPDQASHRVADLLVGARRDDDPGRWVGRAGPASGDLERVDDGLATGRPEVCLGHPRPHRLELR